VKGTLGSEKRRGTETRALASLLAFTVGFHFRGSPIVDLTKRTTAGERMRSAIER